MSVTGNRRRARPASLRFRAGPAGGSSRLLVLVAARQSGKRTVVAPATGIIDYIDGLAYLALKLRPRTGETLAGLHRSDATGHQPQASQVTKVGR